jgi:hypothetical protein
MLFPFVYEPIKLLEVRSRQSVEALLTGIDETGGTLWIYSSLMTHYDTQ